MKDHKIIFVSTSFKQYDRRVQRIIECLQTDWNIEWVARTGKISSDDANSVSNSIQCFFKQGILFYAEFNLRILYKLLFRKFDVISSVDIDTLPACYLISRARNKKLVFDAHEIFHEVPELLNKPIRKRIWKILSQSLFPRTDHRYTVNNSLAHIFKQQFNTHFDVVRNISPLPDIVPDRLPQLQYRTLCYLGVVNVGRGIELAIKSLCELENYKLTVIGDGDIMNDVQLLAQECGVMDRVNFVGYKTPDQIYSIMNTCSIGINMLDPGSDNYKYSLANKFFDYLHIGMPAIHMSFPEYSELIDEHGVGVLASEYTIEALVSGVLSLEKEDQYQRIQNNCLSSRGKLNWTIESIKLLDIYNSLKQKN